MGDMGKIKQQSLVKKKNIIKSFFSLLFICRKSTFMHNHLQSCSASCSHNHNHYYHLALNQVSFSFFDPFFSAPLCIFTSQIFNSYSYSILLLTHTSIYKENKKLKEHFLQMTFIQFGSRYSFFSISFSILFCWTFFLSIFSSFRKNYHFLLRFFMFLVFLSSFSFLFIHLALRFSFLHSTQFLYSHLILLYFSFLFLGKIFRT